MTITSKKTKSRCDQCANKNVKIQRRYKDETYCANCYRIWFIKKPCSRCGNLSRLHKKEEFGVCTDCRIKEPCIRCGDDAIKNGANTQYGRVCQICYQGHFKSKKPCFECGELKRNISSYSQLDHDHEVCITCYQSHVRQTCSLCRRYRELVETEQGMICKKCHEYGEIPCQSCDKLMPAGMGKNCETCYWSQRLEKEAKLNSYLLASQSIKKAYSDFIRWFEVEKSSKTAALKHHNFINFFTRCDEIWGRIPNYEGLVQEFKPNGLREYLTVLRWLIITDQITVDASSKTLIAEQERIANLLAKFEDQVPRCISDYHNHLNQRMLERNTSLKSLRLALQPAIDLCIEYEVKSLNKPTQEHIDGYLLLKQGQYSSLYGFVSFLNKNYSLVLVCNKPSKEDVWKLKNKEVEQEIMRLYNKAKPLSTKDSLKWLQLAMVYFHQVNVPLSHLRALTVQSRNEGMCMITINKKEYWLPTP